MTHVHLRLIDGFELHWTDVRGAPEDVKTTLGEEARVTNVSEVDTIAQAEGVMGEGAPPPDRVGQSQQSVEIEAPEPVASLLPPSPTEASVRTEIERLCKQYAKTAVDPKDLANVLRSLKRTAETDPARAMAEIEGFKKAVARRAP